MRPVLFALLAATALAAPALADDSAAPKEERKICRTAQAPTGSHRPGKRVCLTAAEWRARDAGVEDYAQPDQRTPISGSGTSGSGQ